MQGIKNVLIFFSAFLLVAVLFEFLLSYGAIVNPIERIDPNVGERYCPNIMCCSIFLSEGFGLAPTNSTGWFGKEFKHDDTNDISVAVIGNSFVVARQVFYRDNFLSVAEKFMNSSSLGKHVSFYNFGIEGLRIKELLYLKEEIASEKHPDHILILLKNGVFNSENNHYAPFYEYENGKFNLDTSFKRATFVRNYSKFELISKSSVFLLTYKLKNHFSHAGEILFDKFYTPIQKKMMKVGGADEEAGIEVDSLNILDRAVINELSKDKRVVFILDLNNKLTDQLKSFLPPASVVDIRKPLLKMKEGGVDPNYWPIPNEKGHWTIQAHKVIGEEIAKYLIAENAESSNNKLLQVAEKKK